MSKPKQYSVTLPAGKRPGLMSCGSLQPGKAYSFGAAEAVRLVDMKGFEFANAADEKAARAELPKPLVDEPTETPPAAPDTDTEEG